MLRMCQCARKSSTVSSKLKARSRVDFSLRRINLFYQTSQQTFVPSKGLRWLNTVPSLAFRSPSRTPSCSRSVEWTCFVRVAREASIRTSRRAASAMTHLPTGTVASSRRRRSQHANKRAALVTLRTKLMTLHRRKKPRIPTGVPRRSLERRRRAKRRRSLRKALRRTPKLDDS